MPALTTARALGQYRRDLLAEGIPEELVDRLVMDAAKPLHQGVGELAVSSETAMVTA